MENNPIGQQRLAINKTGSTLDFWDTFNVAATTAYSILVTTMTTSQTSVVTMAMMDIPTMVTITVIAIVAALETSTFS